MVLSSFQPMQYIDCRVTLLIRTNFSRNVFPQKITSLLTLSYSRVVFHIFSLFVLFWQQNIYVQNSICVNINICLLFRIKEIQNERKLCPHSYTTS